MTGGPVVASGFIASSRSELAGGAAGSFATTGLASGQDKGLPLDERVRRSQDEVRARVQASLRRPAPVEPRVAVFPRSRPRLAEGTQLLGECENSGYWEPPGLVRRRDGQIVQLSRVLYLVAAAADGRRSLETISALIYAETGKQVSVSGVKYLLEEKLSPVGLLAESDGASALPRARPLFALRARRIVLPERSVNWLAGRLGWLFRWPVIAGVVAALLCVDYRMFAGVGIAQLMYAAAAMPMYVLLALGLVVASICWHEVGHATGCRYGGARPGPIGVGIFLVWPAFYTNVSDAYRLGRAGRLRTDLGGLYFTAVSAVVFGAAYEATGFAPIAIAIVAVQLQMAVQLLPLVRFDGYYVLTDLVGLPDLFGRIGPILGSLIRRGPVDERVRTLRPRVRRVVTAWVLVVVPLLTAYLGMLLVELPRYVTRAAETVTASLGNIETAFGREEWTGLGVAALQLGAAILPLGGITLVLTRLGRASGRHARQWWQAGGLPRVAVLIGVSVGLGGLVVIWLLTNAVG
jgi:putative peptide zinc metalloprotease protein